MLLYLYISAGNSCASPTASPTYTKVHFTRAELNKYVKCFMLPQIVLLCLDLSLQQKMCNDLLKDTTP